MRSSYSMGPQGPSGGGVMTARRLGGETRQAMAPMRPAASLLRHPGATARQHSAGFTQQAGVRRWPRCLRPSGGRVITPPQAAMGATAAFGQPLLRQPHSSSLSSCFTGRGGSNRLGTNIKPQQSWIHAAAYRRGNTLVICAVLAGAERPTEAPELLLQPIKGEQQLLTGHLENGFRYVLLPNKLPPGRFEAHLEVHAGSVDEKADEQGVAHLVEHVTFLGSKKRENLLGTGARANAYTDFHHTVFHVHSPNINGITGTPMLPEVLEALAEIAFEPQFSATRIEKERKAVLAEAQMMNTIEYRVDCQLLQHLHHENNLGCRFPIGKTEQVKTWPHAAVRRFWDEWYFPANVTLYVVGDLDRPLNETVQLIKDTFGKLPAPSVSQSLAAASATARSNASIASRSSNGNGSSNGNSSSSSSGRSDAFSNNQGGALSSGHAIDVSLVSPSSHPFSVYTTSHSPAQLNGSHSNGNGNGNDNHAASSNGVASTSALSSVIDVESHTVSSVSDASAPEASSPEGEAQQPKQRHALRPPVQHRHGAGPLAPGEKSAEVNIFRHPLLQMFMLSVFCKLPIVSMTRMEHLKYQLMVRIVLSAFQFRINARYVVQQPCFVSIGLDISDSGREGCAVGTLTISSEPAKWKEAVVVGTQEMRRLQRHGLTPGEFKRYRMAILRDSAQLAEQTNKIPSLDTLNFLMESIACGHTIMAHRDAHEAMVAAADTITLEDINALASSLLTFASDYGREAEMLAEAANPAPGRTFAYPGPTRATSIVACVPAYMDESGASISGGGALGDRKAALGAAGHIDADEVDLDALERQAAESEEMEVPEGAIRFDPSPAEIAAVLADQSSETEPIEDVDLPEHLLSPAEVEVLVAERQPRFVPLGGEGTSGSATPPADPFSGVTQRRLSNGILVNYRHTDHEPKSALMRIICPGGRAAEKMEIGPDGFGAVVIGTRTLSEVGTVGKWRREESEVFCVSNLINCAMDADEENIMLNAHFAVGDDGMQRTFELVHLFIEQPVWDENAMERAKQTHLSMSKSVAKSLERATADRIMTSMLGPKRRWREPSAAEIEALTLDGMRKTVTSLWHAGSLEVSVVGDFDADELERCILRYLGTIRPNPNPAPPPFPPTVFCNPAFEQRHQTWHLKDSDERASAYVAGPAPARWGPLGDFSLLKPLSGPVQPPIVLQQPSLADPARRKAALESRRNHPLYASVVLMLLTEIINSRLFTTVRDSLGLTYDVSFEVMMFDRMRTGWFSVHVTSHPDKIYDALAASVAVLRDVGQQPISRRELSRAKTTLLTRHESDMKDNEYWLGLMTHLQSPTVPLKTVDCLRDLKPMYECMTIEDIYDAYSHFKLDDDSIFTCIGTSGKKEPPQPEYVLQGLSYSKSPEDEEEGPSSSASTNQYVAGPPVGGNGAPLPANPMALFTAMMTAAQAMNLTKAFKSVTSDNGSAPPPSPPR